MTVWRSVAEAARRLAREMPAELVDALDRAMAAETVWDSGAQARVLARVMNAHYRELARGFLSACGGAGGALGGEAARVALAVAAECERAHREEQTVELVWTGPDTEAIPLRHTHQAILQLIGAANRRLLLVSYAVFRIDKVREAIVGAADRGVAISVVVEEPERNEGEEAYSTLVALGESVAERAKVYVWPAEKRGRTSSGASGKLHVKCAAADGQRLFISSANLTEHAFEANMELGVLITGGRQPEQVERHFDRLIGAGVLVKVE